MSRLSSQRERTITVVSVVVTLVAVLGFLAFDDGPVGGGVRSLLGVDGRLRPAVEASTEGPYAFLQTQSDGTPVGFSPCRPLAYVVNPAGAPEGWEDDVRDAVEEVSARTGLELADRGATDDRDFSGRGSDTGRTDPVLIGWADEDEVDALADDVAGIGGPTVLRFGERLYFVSGSVVLDTRTTDDLETAPGGRAAHVALLLHELGHLVGLDHVDDEGELMYPEGLTRADYGPGDRAGLAALGAIPCR